MFTDEELEMLQYLIDDPDWDMTQRAYIWERLPRLLDAAKKTKQGVRNNLREKIKKILQDSREEDWAQDLSDPAADEIRTEKFNDEYAITELEKLFISLLEVNELPKGE